MTATSETLDQTTEPGPPSPWLRFGLAAGLGLVGAFLIAVGALLVYDQQYSGRILAGVHVGSVDLSGLTPDAARAELDRAYGSLADGRIVLASVEDRQVITYAEIGRGPDVDRLLDAALAVGRSGSPVERAITDARTAVRGVVLDPTVTIDGEALALRVAAIAESLRIDPVDSTIQVGPDGAFRMVSGKVGRQADPSPVIAALAGGIDRLDAPTEIRLDLDVSPLEPGVTAAEALEAMQAAERMTAELRLVVGEETFPIDAAELRGWVSFQTAADGSYGPVMDTSRLTGLIEAIAAKVDREPLNAKFVTSEGKITAITPSIDGYKLDVAATVANVESMLAARRGGSNGNELVPTLAVTPPALTTAQAEAFAPQMVKIPGGEWTTYFPIGEKNGFGANIWIPALEIDGYVVGPHETFDFWKAIGPVTRERGYRDGGAIINGRTEPQGALAGGICSCSTTLFNAALRAGFEMNARRNHYYYIDRYPLGLDATVFISASGSVQTMSWTNDTDFPVMIRGYKIKDGNRGYVKFELYGVPNGRTVVIGEPTVKNIRPASDSIRYTATLAPGVRKRIEFPVDGKQVWRTRTVYDADGTIIHQETYYSNYARITGIVLVGKAASPPPAETPDPAPDPEPTPTP
jgi:vancomycin resistance protein YoaR